MLSSIIVSSHDSHTSKLLPSHIEKLALAHIQRANNKIDATESHTAISP